MLKYFRVKQQPEKVVPDLGGISLSLLEQDATPTAATRQRNEVERLVMILSNRWENGSDRADHGG